jgi:hypothetical protein
VRRIGESVIHQSSTTKWRVSPSADPFYALNQQRTSSFATGAKAEISGLFTAYNTENILAFAEIRDMSLARSEDSPQRFYSMSAQIRIERKEYYDVLENTQKGELNITPWLEWFLGCLDRAFDGAETILAAVLKKADFWKKHAAARINDRQRDILNHLLDGFEGRLTSSKWALIEKCSPDTALRDISELIELGNSSKGRSRRTQHQLLVGLTPWHADSSETSWSASLARSHHTSRSSSPAHAGDPVFQRRQS